MPTLDVLKFGSVVDDVSDPPHTSWSSMRSPPSAVLHRVDVQRRGGVTQLLPNRRSAQYVLYDRNLPDMAIFTRSPFWSGWRSMVMSKSMADMMPSPNSSWISSFQVVP